MLPKDREFIATKLPAVQGWLLDDAAYLTSGLMRDQSFSGVSGGIFEIGVFAGKYLSLLYHLSQESGEPVLGLDTFQWFPKEGVEKNFASAFGTYDRLTLITSDSGLVTPGEMIKKLGGKPRFVSVDGAHTSAGVLADLKLTEQILSPGGVVAIDDILNPRAIGVSEGAYRYFIGKNGAGLLPFAYCANKLFACHGNDLAKLRDAARHFLDANADLPIASNFRTLLSKGKQWVEQDLFGVPVLIL